VTVAAVVLAGTVEAALAEAAGRPAVRRIAETAWAGGAIPVVVVAADPDGRVAEALAGSEARVIHTDAVRNGFHGQVIVGTEAAVGWVSGTDAALLWPAAHTWVDAETITTLIQAHGLDRGRSLRPTWQGTPGWPVLVPIHALGALHGGHGQGTAEQLADELDPRQLDLGDPGAVVDRTTPLEQVPIYRGPTAPVAPPPEWGAAAADVPEP
jgi:CTP:molybdopterin cytidylyltransferase MocA